MTAAMAEPPVRRLTVLYDAHCRLCRAARRWLSRQDQLVPLEFVAAGSEQAYQRFPTLDHPSTLVDVTIVADTGAVFRGDAAWLICLWALSGYRAIALRLSEPGLRPMARRVVQAAAAIRAGTGEEHYGQECDDACRHPDA